MPISLVALTSFAKPKSRTFTCPACGHEDVRWLDVAMNDPLLVRRIQPVGNLDGEIEQFFDSPEGPLLVSLGGRSPLLGDATLGVCPSRNSITMKG